MDPLAILKEFCVGGQLDQVVIEEDRIKFGDKYSFPKQSPTAFRAKDGSGEPYSLESVTFFIKSITAGGANMGAYVAAAVRARTAQIILQDRQPLRDYLTGKLAHTVHISDVVPTVTFSALEPAAKKQKLDESAQGEAAALRQLLEQEKQLRDRNSLLCAPGANFKPVLDMLDKVLAHRKAAEVAAAAAAANAKAAAGKQQQRPASGQQRPAQQPQPAKPAGPAFMKPSGRMERNDVVGQMKAMGGDASLAANLGYGYGIQVDGQSAAAAAAGKAPAGAAAAGAAGGAAPAAKHRSSSGSSKDARAAAAAGGRSSSHRTGGGAAAGSSSRAGRDPPIILVPSGVTAMINIFNARQFLEEGKFVPSAEAAAAAGNVKPAKGLDYTRTALRSGPRMPRYHVTDKVPRSGHPDWKRVVAVIVQGKAWQFKDFPFKGADKGELRETFTQLFGAYFYYSDEKVPETVEGWKVLKLPLRRTGRHLDHTTMLDFYTKLDGFLQGRRCELDY